MVVSMHVAGKHATASHLHAPELLAAGGDVDPIAIVQMQDGGCGNRGMHVLFLAVERRSDKHPHTHQPGIGNLDAHLGGAQRGIQNRTDVANAAEEDSVGVGIQPNFRGLAYVHAGQIVLKNIAKNPDVAQVGNR